MLTDLHAYKFFCMGLGHFLSGHFVHMKMKLDSAHVQSNVQNSSLFGPTCDTVDSYRNTQQQITYGNTQTNLKLPQ